MKHVLICILWCMLLAGMVTAPARADCIYQGNYYPTGTRLGDLTCQPDGTWR
jgi:hypothetical protein